MSRHPLCFVAALLAAIVPTLGTAADPPKIPMPPAPPPTLVDARIEKGSLIVEVHELVPVQKQILFEYKKGDQTFAEMITVTVFETVTVLKQLDLKQAKATDATGKAIPLDKLAEQLKEITPIVTSHGPVADKHRKLFKDQVVFIEFPPPKPEPVPPPKKDPPIPEKK